MEGVEEPEAISASVAVETDEAQSAVSPAGVWEDGLQVRAGDADSPPPKTGCHTETGRL